MKLFVIFQFTILSVIGETTVPKTQKVEPVIKLKDLSSGHNVVGKKIQVECQTTFYAKYVSIEWKTPKHEIYQNVNVRESTNSSYVTTSTLVVHKAETRHSGLYICEIIHKQLNYSLATGNVTIKVYGKKDHLIDIEIHDDGKEQALVQFEFLIKAHPAITIKWVTNRNEIISVNSTNIAVSLTPTTNYGEYNYIAKITFNYVNSDVEGNYVLVVNNGIEESRHRFEIGLVEWTWVNLDFIGIGEDKMTAVYQCRALGAYKPKITWTFKPCETFACLEDPAESLSKDEIILKDFYYEDQGLQVVSYVAINLTDVGILKCVSQGSEAVKKVFHAKNKFEYFVENSANFSDVGKKRVAAEYDQKVKIFCLRSLFKYTSDIFWYHNGKKINDNFIFITPYNMFSYEALDELMFYFSVEDHIGNLTCQVLTRTGEIESQTVEIVSKNVTSLYPKISFLDLNGGHTTVGQDIRLVCNVTYYKHVDISWWFSRKEDRVVRRKLIQLTDNQRIINKNVNTIVDDVYITNSYLTISKANVTESVYYGCSVSGGIIELPLDVITGKKNDINYMWIKIYDINETRLSFEEKIEFDVANMNIKVLLEAHPPPTIKWFDNHGKEIGFRQTETSNFLLSSKQISDRKRNDANYEATLTFHNIDTKDLGNYTVVAENEHGKINYSIAVDVTGEPTAKIDIYSMSANNVTVKCSSFAYPQPTIEWYFKKCTTLKSCLESNSEFKFQNGYLSLSELWNERNGLQIISYISIDLSKRGVLVCRTANFFGQKYSYELVLGTNPGFEMSVANVNQTKYSDKSFQVVGDNLDVICAATKPEYANEFSFSAFNGKYGPYQIDIGKRSDFLFSSFWRGVLYTSTSDFYSCTVLKNGFFDFKTIYVEQRSSAFVNITKTNLANNSLEVDVRSKWTFYCYFKGFPTPNLTWYKNDQVLEDSDKFKFTDGGQVLEIDDIFLDDEGIYKCKVSNNYSEITKYTSLSIRISNIWPYVQITLLVSAVVFIAILVFMKFLKYKKIQKKLESFGLFYSHKNNLHRINPNLSIEDQAALLPFDQKWEIPFENIIIGKQLGSGAFGVTFQATIVNYFPNDPMKTVAVKTVNSTSGFECTKALASELKILSHLGNHVNIVNFFGACTRRLVKDELYIVLEFCSFGSLSDYIKKHSEHFIDYKDYDSDVFNWGEDDENTDNKTSVSSKNFLVWDFQIARGMEYLGSRRVVHGDLAARNVLLTDENIVKVCDFGLAKNVYNYGNYVRKSQGLLPIKWMAVEAIQKGIFSTQSDVWSFGIVLWELFSLSKTPYFGVTVDENFCKKLIEGYRMEQPETATSKIYKLMLDCWQLDPLLRPSFSELGEQIGSFLEDTVKNYYIIMNNDYIIMNQEQFDKNSDYLTMVNHPTYQNLVSKSSEIHETEDRIEDE